MQVITHSIDSRNFSAFFPCIFDAFSCQLIKLSDLYWAVFFLLFPIISVRTAVIVVCFICPICLSLRDNAACCIPLRDLRNLRENIHVRVLKLYYTNETPISLADYANDRRRNPKQQKQQQPSPACLSLRYNAALAAFLCVICAICGRIYIQTYSINIHRRNPNKSPADAADNAEKDNYHIVECCSCLYNKSLREHACCSLLVLCHFLALSFLARSLFVLCSFLM